MPLANLLGICGAPSTGKTTLARRLHSQLLQAGLDCALLGEPARELARRGVRIDAAMRPADYDAFLAAYIARDTACCAIGVADRTPADHFCYLAANAGLPREFTQRHHDAALSALAHYRAIIYLPPELALIDDAFRITNSAYRLALDRALCDMLSQTSVPVITIRGARAARLAAASAVAREYWPELSASAQLRAGT